MVVAQTTSLLHYPKENPDKKTAKALTCKRGHDTSFPEARDRQSHCIVCERVNSRERSARYARTERGKKIRQAYANTPKEKYRVMKRDLRYRMTLKRKQVSQLEEELQKYEQEISRRNGKG